MSKLTTISNPKIGDILGYRDNYTVRYERSSVGHNKYLKVYIEDKILFSFTEGPIKGVMKLIKSIKDTLQNTNIAELDSTEVYLMKKLVLSKAGLVFRKGRYTTKENDNG